MEEKQEFDFVDYTYVSVSLFKLIEILFNDLLKKYWNDEKIISKAEVEKANKSNVEIEGVDVNNEKLMLGEMKQFLYATNTKIVNHLRTKQTYTDLLREKMGIWLEEKRNGYLHKHVQGLDKLKDSISATFELMCLIVLVIKK